MRWYGAAVLACILGVGSKEIAITAPLAVILYDRAFRLDSWRAVRTAPNGRSRFYAVLSFTALAAFALFSLGGRGASAGFDHGIAWYGYLYTQCWAIPHYLLLVVWPSALSVDYSQKVISECAACPARSCSPRLPRPCSSAGGGFRASAGSRFSAPGFSSSSRRRRASFRFRASSSPSGAFTSRSRPCSCCCRRRRMVATCVHPRRCRSASSGSALANRRALALTTATAATPIRRSELLWRDAVHKVPDNPRAWDNLGMALYREGPPHFAEAEGAFGRRSRRIRPAISDARNSPHDRGAGAVRGSRLAPRAHARARLGQRAGRADPRARPDEDGATSTRRSRISATWRRNSRRSSTCSSSASPIFRCSGAGRHRGIRDGIADVP